MAQQDSSLIHTYVFNSDDNLNAYTTQKLLILLFTEKPGKHYRSHKEICKELKNNLGINRTQGAVSKAFQAILDTPFKVRNTQYVIKKHEGNYLLLNMAKYTENLRHEMVSDGLFEKEMVYYEHGTKNPQTFVFWVCKDKEKTATVKSNFEKMLADGFIDIFNYQNKLVVMLDPKSEKQKLLSDVLKNFFDPYYDAYKVIK